MAVSVLASYMGDTRSKTGDRATLVVHWERHVLIEKEAQNETGVGWAVCPNLRT